MIPPSEASSEEAIVVYSKRRRALTGFLRDMVDKGNRSSAEVKTVLIFSLSSRESDPLKNGYINGGEPP